MTYRRIAPIAVSAGLVFALPAAAQDGTVQTKQYEDGGIYEGTFKDGLQQGNGNYTMPNG